MREEINLKVSIDKKKLIYIKTYTSEGYVSITTNIFKFPFI